MNAKSPVDEVRAVREKHAKKFGYDLNQIAEDIVKEEHKLLEDGWNLVYRKRTSSNQVETIPLKAPRSIG